MFMVFHHTWFVNSHIFYIIFSVGQRMTLYVTMYFHYSVLIYWSAKRWGHHASWYASKSSATRIRFSNKCGKCQSHTRSVHNALSRIRQPRWLSGLRRSHVHSQLIARRSLCPEKLGSNPGQGSKSHNFSGWLWQRDVKLQQTKQTSFSYTIPPP